MLRALLEQDITLVSLVATTLARLLDAGLARPPALRCALTGGGPVSEALLARARAAGVPVSLTYGLTEACSQVTTTPVGEAGRPARRCSARACASPRDGEILVAGPTVATAGADGDGWLHTGDLGALDAYGRLRVTGRKADTIVSGGENVAPAEVEGVLEAHPDVLEAAVLGRPDARWGEAVTAIVLARPGQTLDEDALRAPLRAPASPLQGAQADRAHRRAAAAHAVGQAAAPGALVNETTPDGDRLAGTSSASGFDANAHRDASLRSWEEAAAGWVRQAELLRELGAPVSHWLIDAVMPQPGQRVLELAAGLGETGMLAAELVAPMGGAVISDQAETMLAGARARAASLGLSNVEFQVLNAEWIDLPVASVDVVLCRWGYMLMADPACGARRDAPRAAPRRQRRAGRVGRDRAQPVGAPARARAGRARAGRSTGSRCARAVRAREPASSHGAARLRRLRRGAHRDARSEPPSRELPGAVGLDPRSLPQLPRCGARPPRR